jgi:co-chaperonin GroES (HSP10)
MTKSVFHPERGWTRIEDGPVAPNTNLPVPLAALEEMPEPVFDLAKLPFKRVLNGHIIIKIDAYARPKGKRVAIPDTAKRAPTKGRVVAKADDITDVEIGDKVLYSQFAGYLLVFEGLPAFRSIGHDEMLAVLKDDAPDLVLEGA